MRAPAAAILVAILFAGGMLRASPAEPEGAPDLVSDFNAVENPTITAEMDAPATLSIGRAEIRPEPGSRLLLLSVHGRDAGYLLEGKAKLVYRVEDVRKAGRHLASRRYFGFAERHAFDEFYDDKLLKSELSSFQRSYAYVLEHGVDAVNADMQSQAHLRENFVAAATSSQYFA